MACFLKRPCREVRKGYRQSTAGPGACASIMVYLWLLVKTRLVNSNQMEQVHEILWGIHLRDIQGEGPGRWGRLLQRPLGETITRAIDESHQEFIFICDWAVV